jgi:hypothetical protein
MKCYIQVIDHSKCPTAEDGKPAMCAADPCVVMAAHQKTAVFTICGNEVTSDDYMCDICRGQFNVKMAELLRAKDEATARQAAIDALAEAALTSEGGPHAGTEQ